MMFLASLLYMLLQVSFVLSVEDVPGNLTKRDDATISSRKWQYNCQDKGYSALEVEAWDTYFELTKYAQLWKVVPLIGWGNGKTRSGQNKGMQFDNSISSANDTVANGIWLNVRFFNEECTGSVNFAQGNDTAAKVEYCTNNFMSIWDGCQTDTRQAKYGGALQTNCLCYQIQGRTPNTTDNYRLANPGPLIYNPTQVNNICTI